MIRIYLGSELEAIVAKDPGLYFYSRRITLADWIKRFQVDADNADFFSEGVHPSMLTYPVWARDVAGYISEQPGLLVRDAIHG